MEPCEHQWGDHKSASQRPDKALDTVVGTCQGLGKVRGGLSRDGTTTGLAGDAGSWQTRGCLGDLIPFRFVSGIMSACQRYSIRR